MGSAPPHRGEVDRSTWKGKTFLTVSDIPRTLTGKNCEVPVKRTLEGVDADKAVSRSALQNPESLEPFIQVALTP